MTKKVLVPIILILILAAGAYWYFAMRPRMTDTTSTPQSQNGFVPINRSLTGGGDNSSIDSSGTDQTSTTTSPASTIKIPTLRLLSNTPVGGYTATTTASTTVTRWVDRGRGNVYEAKGNDLNITTISNTVVPKIFESIWNKNATAFVASIFDDNGQVSTIFADIKTRLIPKIATSTTASSTLPTTTANTQALTPYELKGKTMPGNLISYVASPKKDKLFLLMREGDGSAGYTSTFDGKSLTQIFTSPLTQVNVEWPEEKTIAITTKGSASEAGFLYFVDPKTGVWKKIVGPFPGLSTRVSTDAKRVLISVTGNTNNVLTSIYDVSKKAGTDAIIRTIADKCVWGNFYKEMVYCATPSQNVSGVYPDDWYLGTLSTIDKIWQINATSGELQLVSSIIDTSDRVIDAFNLGLDDRDDFLFFMNKNDLSLWSLDLVSSN